MARGTIIFRIGPPVVDSIPPIVSIFQPQEGATVILNAGQPLLMSGSASDNTGVSYVEVSIDNGSFVRASGTTNWSISFINVPAGSHSIRARARDLAGNFSATVARAFFVQAPGGGGGFKTFNFTKAANFLMVGHTEPDVILVNGVFHMYYRNDSGGKPSISLATSPNGTTNWTERGTMLSSPASGWDSAEVIAPSVFVENGQYFMYYEADDLANIGRRQVGLAVANSPTGPFVRAATNPVLAPAGGWESGLLGTPAMTPKRINGKCILFYHGFQGGADRVGVAYSNSPLGPFTKEQNNPLVNLGPAGSWDDGKTAPSSVYVDDDNKIYLLYEGWDGVREHIWYWRIGIAHGILGSNNRIESMTKAPNNPVINLGPPGSWDDTTVQLPSVIRVGNELWVYFSANDEQGFKVGLAKATIPA